MKRWSQLWSRTSLSHSHDDVIEWKHYPRYWPFVRGIHRSPVNSSHKGQWREALIFSFICALINNWVNNREPGDLRRYRAHYDVIVMVREKSCNTWQQRVFSTMGYFLSWLSSVIWSQQSPILTPIDNGIYQMWFGELFIGKTTRHL